MHAVDEILSNLLIYLVIVNLTETTKIIITTSMHIRQAASHRMVFIHLTTNEPGLESGFQKW